MVLDSADLSRLVATGGAADVVTHEFGHVLGFGTRWTTPGLPPLALDAGLPATRFVGPGARDAAAALGYVGDGQDVPLESGGGFGTRDAHWSETRFGRELMTGFYDPGVANPLSLVSVRAMGDIGYEISEVGAEPTSVLETVPGTTSPFGLLRSIVAAPLSDRAYDVVRAAEWVVGADGAVRRMGR